MMGVLVRLLIHDSHPTARLLVAFLLRNLSSGEIDCVRAHVAVCERCRSKCGELDRAIRQAEVLYFEQTPDPAIVAEGRQRILLEMARRQASSFVAGTPRQSAIDELAFYAGESARTAATTPESMEQERRILEVFLGKNSAWGLTG